MSEQIRCLRFDTDDRTLSEVPSDSLCEVLNEPNSFTRIDIQGSDVVALNTLLRELGTEMSVGHHFHYPAVLPRVFEHRADDYDTSIGIIELAHAVFSHSRK